MQDDATQDTFELRDLSLISAPLGRLTSVQHNSGLCRAQVPCYSLGCTDDICLWHPQSAEKLLTSVMQVLSQDSDGIYGNVHDLTTGFWRHPLRVKYNTATEGCRSH